MTTEKIEALLRDLVTAFIERPADMRIASQEAADKSSLYIALQPHLEDEPRLVGSHGCHVDALKFLISSLGMVHGKTYTFRLLTVGRPGDSKKRQELDVLSYDPEPARAILQRLMVAFEIPCLVEVGPGAGARNSLTFVFTIKVTDRDYYRGLTVPMETDRDTLIGAIGTIFRAIAKRGGVRFQINVEQV